MAVWSQLLIRCRHDEVAALEEYLEEAGALSITLEDDGDEPLLEPPPGEAPLWAQTRLTALLPEHTDETRLLAALQARFPNLRRKDLSVSKLADRDWVTEWRRDFHPMHFGGSLWVASAEALDGLPADATPVRMEPGLAFGTGTHPTTALCLEWLAERPPAGLRVLDYGCGSGILAIAALKLGAGAAVATDLDPQARQAARENAVANDVADRVEVCTPEDTPAGPYDVVLANILARPLVALADTLTARVAAGGWLVLSGLLESQADAVAAAYNGAFPRMLRQTCGGWVRLSGRRRHTPPRR